jgi:hypothetical protein
MALNPRSETTGDALADERKRTAVATLLARGDIET